VLLGECRKYRQAIKLSEAEPGLYTGQYKNVNDSETTKGTLQHHEAECALDEGQAERMDDERSETGAYMVSRQEAGGNSSALWLAVPRLTRLAAVGLIQGRQGSRRKPKPTFAPDATKPDEFTFALRKAIA